MTSMEPISLEEGEIYRLIETAERGAVTVDWLRQIHHRFAG